MRLLTSALLSAAALLAATTMASAGPVGAASTHAKVKKPDAAFAVLNDVVAAAPMTEKEMSETVGGFHINLPDGGTYYNLGPDDGWPLPVCSCTSVTIVPGAGVSY